MENIEKSSFSENVRVSRIKELLKDKGLKQKDLADVLDIEPQNLSRCLTSGKVSEKTCLKIIEAFPEYRLEWLLGYNDYKTEEEITEATPFDEYKAYIESKTWDKKRTERLIFDDFQCQICGNRNNIQVHHLVYPAHKNYGTEPISDLITVCEGCHLLIDKLRKGQTIKIKKKYATDYSDALIAIKFNSYEEANDYARQIYDAAEGNENLGAMLCVKEGDEYMKRIVPNAFTFADLPKLKEQFGEENVKISIKKFKEEN